MEVLAELKLMFLRIQSEENVFSESTLSGIMGNQWIVTEALHTLWKASKSEHFRHKGQSIINLERRQHLKAASLSLKVFSCQEQLCW